MPIHLTSVVEMMRVVFFVVVFFYLFLLKLRHLIHPFVVHDNC